MKQSLILLNIFLYSLTALAQTSGLKDRINTFDSTGKKTGFWVQVDDGYKTETYYLHGIKNGLEKFYYRNGSLGGFFKYKDGHKTGTGYYFHDKGYLSFTVQYSGFENYKNKNLQKGYFTIYYPDGSIQERGTGLFAEGDEELGEEIKIGKWEKFPLTTQKINDTH